MHPICALYIHHSSKIHVKMDVTLKKQCSCSTMVVVLFQKFVKFGAFLWNFSLCKNPFHVGCVADKQEKGV